MRPKPEGALDMLWFAIKAPFEIVGHLAACAVAPITGRDPSGPRPGGMGDPGFMNDRQFTSDRGFNEDPQVRNDPQVWD